MPKAKPPKFSEFSYAFALTYELMEKHSLKHLGAPFFPTQVEEAKFGYDLHLPAVDVYLQFKRSDRLISKSAKPKNHFKTFPFFRWHLYRKPHQHIALLDLEARGGSVFYAAPGFNEVTELCDALTNKEVVNRSIFVRPSEIGKIPDLKSHSVNFQTHPRLAYFCSEPRELKTESPEAIFGESLLNRLRTDGEKPTDGYFNAISDRIIKLAEKMGEHQQFYQLLEDIERQAATDRGISTPLPEIEEALPPNISPVSVIKLMTSADFLSQPRDEIDRTQSEIQSLNRIREEKTPAQFAQICAQVLLDSQLLLYQPKND